MIDAGVDDRQERRGGHDDVGQPPPVEHDASRATPHDRGRRDQRRPTQPRPLRSRSRARAPSSGVAAAANSHSAPPTRPADDPSPVGVGEASDVDAFENRAHTLVIGRSGTLDERRERDHRPRAHDLRVAPQLLDRRARAPRCPPRARARPRRRRPPPCARRPRRRGRRPTTAGRPARRCRRSRARRTPRAGRRPPRGRRSPRSRRSRRSRASRSTRRLTADEDSPTAAPTSASVARPSRSR